MTSVVRLRVSKDSMIRFRAALWMFAGVVSACSADRTLAPRVVGVEGTSVRVEAYLWRDFQPISPPDGKPLVAILRIQTVDGARIPSTLTADSAWVYNGASVWATAVVEEQPRGAGAAAFQVVARNGPKWGPGVEVDVVVRLRDAAGHGVLLQAPGQLIGRTD